MKENRQDIVLIGERARSRALHAALAWLRARWSAWQRRRRQRQGLRELLRLEPHQLVDIGLHPDDVREAGRRWQRGLPMAQVLAPLARYRRAQTGQDGDRSQDTGAGLQAPGPIRSGKVIRLHAALPASEGERA